MSKKALIVDNDFFFMKYFSDLLKKRGYEVVKAYDGKEGISRLEEGSVDMLFVDMVMPKIDGEQLINYVRKKYPDAPFPVILMSDTIVERLDMIDKIGADYYIAKGKMEKMADQVNDFLDRLEKQPLFTQEDNDFLEPGKVYPRQATAELLDSLSFHRAITESTGVGIIVVDKDARIMGANPLALNLINKPIEETLNRPVTALFPKEEKAKIIDTLKKIISDRTLSKIDFSMTINFQKVRIIVSVFQVGGKISGWIMAMIDSDR